jgi:hypothetical protein
VHILDEIAIGAVFVLATALLHILSLVYLYFYMSKTFQKTNGEQYSAVQIVKILSIVIFFILMIHTIEAWLWACLYWFLGEFSDFGQALYFSVVTSTTLGYGDVTLSERKRLGIYTYFLTFHGNRLSISGAVWHSSLRQAMM